MFLKLGFRKFKNPKKKIKTSHVSWPIFKKIKRLVREKTQISVRELSDPQPAHKLVISVSAQGLATTPNRDLSAKRKYHGTKCTPARHKIQSCQAQFPLYGFCMSSPTRDFFFFFQPHRQGEMKRTCTPTSSREYNAHNFQQQMAIETTHKNIMRSDAARTT